MKTIFKELSIDCALVAGVGCLARGAAILHPVAPWLVVGLALTLAGVLGVRALAIEKREAAKR
jgi:hypothetical protein